MRHLVTTAVLLCMLVAPVSSDELSDLCAELIAESGAASSPEQLNAQMTQGVAAHGWTVPTAWSRMGAASSLAGRVEPAVYCFAHAAQAQPDEAVHLNLSLIHI